jgi:hypothetical protein
VIVATCRAVPGRLICVLILSIWRTLAANVCCSCSNGIEHSPMRARDKPVSSNIAAKSTQAGDGAHTHPCYRDGLGRVLSCCKRLASPSDWSDPHSAVAVDHLPNDPLKTEFEKRAIMDFEQSVGNVDSEIGVDAYQVSVEGRMMELR